MIRNAQRNWRRLIADQRGNSLISYALLLGGLAVLLAGAMGDFSVDLSDYLTHQASSLEATAGRSTAAPAPAATTPSSPTTTSGGSGSSGGGNSGRRGRR